MYKISYLTKIYFDKTRNEKRLHQSEITEFYEFETFEDFAVNFLEHEYPKPQSNKYETYGFVPAFFTPGMNTPRIGKEPKFGLWRMAEYIDPETTLIVLDCDNSNEYEPMVSFEDAMQFFEYLDIPYLMYETFSSKKQHPKFRIIIPPSRPLSHLEAFDATRWFSQRLNNQIDMSVTDPGDFNYTIPHGARAALRLAGKPLDACTPVTRLPLPIFKTKSLSAPLSPEEQEKLKVLLADDTIRTELSIYDSDLCRTIWLNDHTMLYNNQSHSQTLMGTLCRIWLSQQGHLTFGEMRELFSQLDALYGGYVLNKYGEHERDRMIMTVMSKHVTKKLMSASKAIKIIKRRKKNGR